MFLTVSRLLVSQSRRSIVHTVVVPREAGLARTGVATVYFYIVCLVFGLFRGRAHHLHHLGVFLKGEQALLVTYIAAMLAWFLVDPSKKGAFEPMQ